VARPGPAPAAAAALLRADLLTQLYSSDRLEADSRRSYRRQHEDAHDGGAVVARCAGAWVPWRKDDAVACCVGMMLWLAAVAVTAAVLEIVAASSSPAAPPTAALRTSSGLLLKETGGHTHPSQLRLRTAAAAGCKLVPGRDYSDAAGPQLNASSAAHCCSLCARDSNCAVSVYKFSNKQCYTKLGANLPIDRGAGSGIVGCLPECTGGRVIPHSNRATSAQQCTGALGDACAFKCDAGFWPVGSHVCQTYAVDGRIVINAFFSGGRCDRLCGGSAASSCPTKGEVPIRSNTTDSSGVNPCLKTVCMSKDDALKNVGRGAYHIWQLARNTQTGCVRDHVDLGVAAQPDCPCWIGGTGLQLIFECVAVEMGWTSRTAAQAKVIHTLRGLNGKLPGYTMARNPHGFFSVFFNQSTGGYLGRPGVRTYTPMDSGFMMGGVLFAKSYFNHTDPGSSSTNTIVTLADELWRSTRFDSLLCNRAGLVDPTGTGVPMLQGANASICSATQFPQPDGFYEYTEETYSVWYAYVQACGGNANGSSAHEGCRNKAIETMWKAWQGRRTTPNHRCCWTTIYHDKNRSSD
jgi:hypothetical protein